MDLCHHAGGTAQPEPLNQAPQPLCAQPRPLPGSVLPPAPGPVLSGCGGDAGASIARRRRCRMASSWLSWPRTLLLRPLALLLALRMAP